jgi:hypothetical protein
VKKQCQIQDKRVLELLKNLPIRDQLRVIGRSERVELVNADQCMFVGRVAMQKLMLHEARQLAEFWNISTQEIDPMHHSENAACFTFS